MVIFFLIWYNYYVYHGRDYMKQITIVTEYITLGQFLKIAGLVETGGEAKIFLSSHEIRVDSLVDNRRGRKLYPGMTVGVLDQEYLICSAND